MLRHPCLPTGQAAAVGHGSDDKDGDNGQRLQVMTEEHVLTDAVDQDLN